MLHRVADFRGREGPSGQSERSTQAIRFYGDQRSNPLCSSGESAANLTLGVHPAARLPPHVSRARNNRLCDGSEVVCLSHFPCSGIFSLQCARSTMDFGTRILQHNNLRSKQPAKLFSSSEDQMAPTPSRWFSYGWYTMILSQKSQSWRAPNCALVKVDKLGTFSDRYSGTPS